MPEATKQTSEDFIGLDKLYIAKLVSDDESGCTYGTPEPFAPVAQLTKTTSSETLKTYYDNAPYRAITSEDSDELGLTVPALDLATLAMITGKTIDATSKALIDSGDPQTAYFAILARAQMSDMSYRYYCFNKVSFAIPDETIDTKGETITNNGQVLTGTAIRTIFKYSIGDTTSGVKRIVVDERDGLVDVSQWYDAVPVPGNIPLITSGQ